MRQKRWTTLASDPASVILAAVVDDLTHAPRTAKSLAKATGLTEPRLARLLSPMPSRSGRAAAVDHDTLLSVARHLGVLAPGGKKVDDS